MDKSWYESFMPENEISMPENEIFMHENEISMNLALSKFVASDQYEVTISEMLVISS